MSWRRQKKQLPCSKEWYEQRALVGYGFVLLITYVFFLTVILLDGSFSIHDEHGQTMLIIAMLCGLVFLLSFPSAASYHGCSQFRCFELGYEELAVKMESLLKEKNITFSSRLKEGWYLPKGNMVITRILELSEKDFRVEVHALPEKRSILSIQRLSFEKSSFVRKLVATTHWLKTGSLSDSSVKEMTDLFDELQEPEEESI